MSSNVVRISDLTAPASAEDYLGPAEVVRVEGDEVHVELPGASGLRSSAPVRAEMALAFPYEPSPGDLLLVIGKARAYYVIGVLKGSGKTVLALPGDVDLRAGGSLSLSSEKGMKLTSAELEIHTGKLQMVASSVMQRFSSVYQRVSELLSVHARETHTLVEQTSCTQARSAVILTQETMTINGNEIHLG